MRKRLLATLVVAMAMLAPMGLPLPASAEIYQCDTGGPSNYFDGYYWSTATHTQGFEGARADITNHFGAVCDTDHSGPNPGTNTIGNNFTTAWAMIASADSRSWVQSGVIRGYNTPQYLWSEHILNEPGYGYQRQDRFTSNPSVADGSRNRFMEYWTSSCSCERAAVDTTIIYSTTYNPVGIWPIGGNGSIWSPQYSGEKTYQASDIMGVPTAHVVFDTMEAQQFSNDAWVAQPCGLSGSFSATRASHSSTGCQEFEIWTSS